jgi:hypothetical protein
VGGAALVGLIVALSGTATATTTVTGDAQTSPLPLVATLSGPIHVVNGRSEPTALPLTDNLRAPVVVSAVTATGDALGLLHLGPLEVLARHHAATLAGLYRRVRSVRIAAGHTGLLGLVVTGPRDCRGFATLSALRIRYTVSGAPRTEVDQLHPTVRIDCSFTAAPAQ